MPELTETTERRFVTIGSELRATEGESPKIIGYAAVFGQKSDDLGGFREVIKRGAFKASIANGDDVRALIDHNPTMILGRTSAGTLQTKEDRHGLKVEIDPPDTQAARDLMTSIGRGDISQMSFQFRTIEDSWRTVDGEELRELRQVDLIDVSAVTFPAYPQTDVALRSLEHWRDEQKPAPEAEATPNDTLRLKLDLAETE